ncbi:unnamed protein product [Peniophora sp. CBMAI 1063]|nr:unnamed protein product [Peniophora sp. CBMAI 1063]
MADRLSNGFAFGQGFGANGLDGQIGGMPNVDQTPQWSQFGQSHAMNPMNPQMAQLLGQRNAQAGAQMQNNFQQHGLFEQQFGGAGGLLNNNPMNAIQAQGFNNAARAQQPHQPFLAPNNDMVRQMGLLAQQNTPLHQQQTATMQLLNQRLGHPGQQQNHLGQPQPHPQQAQQQQQQNRSLLIALVNGVGQPQQNAMTGQVLQQLPSLRPEELVQLARQCRMIESELSNRIGEATNQARGGANTIQSSQQIQALQKKHAFAVGFGHKIQQEIMVRKDKGQLPAHVLQQIPPPQGGPLPRTLPNGMTNPDWLKAHGAPPDLFTNGSYPQHEVQAAVNRMRESIIAQNAGPQATQSQLAQLQAMQAQHANHRAPSRQQAPGPGQLPNPATPGLPHASPMPQPANVNPQQAPPQQPGGPQAGGGMTPDNLAARLRNIPPCAEEMFPRAWHAWMKQAGVALSMDDIQPPETLQGKPSISLWRLHALVWQAGGYDNIGDRWPTIAGRLGWGTMNDAQGMYAPPMAAERLRQHHASHLREFEKWYLSISRARIMQSQGQQNQLAARMAPERVTQAMQAAAMGVSAEELKARGVGDDVIQFVEANREALLAKHREQTAFKQGLQQQQQQQQQQQGQPPNMAMHPQPPPHMNGGMGQPGQPHVNGGGVGGPGNVHAPPPLPPQGQPPQLFGPVPAARDLKGVRPDGSIDPLQMRATLEHISQLKKAIEPQLLRTFKTVDAPVDVDRNEWMSLLERGSGLAADIDKTLPMFIAYTQGPNQQLGPILSKMMKLTFQKRLVSQAEPRFIVDLNELRGYIQQFSNLLVILTNRIAAVRMELQQLHGIGPRPGSTQQLGPPGPPGPPNRMGPTLGVPGQQPPHIGLPGQPPTPQLGRVPTPQHRAPTPQQQMNHRVPTPQFPPTPLMNSAEAMPPPLPPNVAAKQHVRKPSDMQSPAGGSPHTPAPANAASPQTPQTPKQKPKPKPKVQRRKSTVQAPAAAAAEQTDDKKDVLAESSSAASTSTAKTGNKRPREEDATAIAAAAASPKRAKADWEGAPSDAQEQRAKAAEEAPKDDAAAANFVDNMMREFAQFEGDTAPFVSGINAILASVLPGADGAAAVGSSGVKEEGADLGGLDDTFDFSQYFDFDGGQLGAGVGGGGTVGATPELVHGSSANPSPESGSEPEAGSNNAAVAAASTGPSSDKTPGSLDLGFDDPLHVGAWSEIDGGETSYYHGGVGWRWDQPMSASEQPWAISTS